MELELHLTEKEFCSFVGPFHACTGNTQIDEKEAENFLKGQMDFSSKEECKEFKIIDFTNRYKSIQYNIELTLESSYEFSKDESGFRNNVYNFFSYALYHRSHKTIIREIEYHDNISEIKLDKKYYMVLKNDMNPIHYETLGREFKLGEQRVDRLYYEPTYEDEDGVERIPKNTQEFFDNFDYLDDLSGFIVCNEIGLSYFLHNIDNKNVRFFECMCGGDVIDMSPNIKRFETVILTKELYIDDIKSNIKNLNLSFDLNEILFGVDTEDFTIDTVSEELHTSINNFMDAIPDDIYDFREEVMSRLSKYLEDPFVAESIMKITSGYKEDSLYDNINGVIKRYFNHYVYDHSNPMFLCAARLIDLFKSIDFTDICEENFKIGSDFVKKGIYPIYDRNGLTVYNSKNTKPIKISQ